ncbi:MAG: hypothetical protein J6D54_05510 [Olsenella sp.]|nr:hypothetical protein [Olsenella sp.]
MLSVSQGFRDAVALGRRVELKATLSLGDGMVVELEGKDFAMGGYSLSGSTSSLSKFEIGSAVIGTAKVTLANYDQRWNDVMFSGSTIVVYVGYEVDDEVEWLLRGSYGIEQPKSYGATIELSCYDNMRLLEHPYSEIGTIYPATLGTIAADICAGCGLTLLTPEFQHHDYEVRARPEDTDASCIEVIGWVAQAAGCFADVDPQGRLRIRWYNVESFDTENAHAEVTAIKSHNVNVSEVGISGLHVTAWRAPSDNGTYKEGESSLYGIDGYVLKISNNPLVEYGRAEEVAQMLGPAIGDMWFRPLTATAIGDPTVEPGEAVILTDEHGRSYRTWATQLTWKASGSMNISCGAEVTSRVDQPKRRSASQVASQDLTKVLEKVGPDNFYMYHGENADPLSVTTESTVANIKFATVADTRIALNVTVEHEMNLDGDVVGRIYVNGTCMKTIEVYEARGKAVLDFMWNYEFSKDRTYDLFLTLETVGVISQIRENDADNQTLWNRSRANSKVYWQELAEAETWDSMQTGTWERWASGSAASGTWAALMAEDELDWDVIEPVATRPTLTIEPQRGQMVLFGRGLARIDSWDGVVHLYETLRPLSLKSLGLVVGYSESLEADAHTPLPAGISETVGLSLVQPGLVVGYSEGIAFGEDSETVWAADLVYDSAAIHASGATWSASAAATVDTVDFGLDRTVRGIASVAVATSGDIAFCLSFDEGQTWCAAMDADSLNAKTDWPEPPLRIRMDMEAGSRVNGLTINYER